jgi:hypothetical protein
MNKKRNTLLVVGAIALIGVIAFRKKKPMAIAEGEELTTKKANIPSGGGGGGFGVPIAPAYAVPTSQVIVQTQPTSPSGTSGTVNIPSSAIVSGSTAAQATADRSDVGTSAAQSTTTSTGGGTTTSTGGGTMVGSGGAGAVGGTGGSAAGGGGTGGGASSGSTTASDTSSSTSVRFMDYFNVDAQGQDILESIL